MRTTRKVLLVVDDERRTAGAAAPDADGPYPDGPWDSVFRAHAAAVYRHARRMTGSHGEAEDLVQDVFVRAIEHLGDRDPHQVERLGGWLYRITTNLFLDRVRRKNRIQFSPLTEHITEAWAATEPDPAEVVATRTLSPELSSGLLGLSEVSRQVLVLRAVEGLPYEDIAAAVGVARGTVASCLHRSRSQLRTQLSCPALGRPSGRLGPIPAERALADPAPEPVRASPSRPGAR